MAGHVQNRVRAYTKDITLASQASATDISLFTVEPGQRFLYGVITASATLGATATVAIGITGATGKYRTAATFTAANTPTLFGNVAPMDDVLTAEEDLLLTIAADDLPSSGQVSLTMFFGNA